MKIKKINCLRKVIIKLTNLLTVTKINNSPSVQAQNSKLRIKAVNLNQKHCRNLFTITHAFPTNGNDVPAGSTLSQISTDRDNTEAPSIVN